MKTKNQLLRTLSFAALIITSVAAFSFTSFGQQATNQPTTYTISGLAAGSQMVPAVQGDGAGTISGTYDPSTHVLNYTSNWSNLSGAPTTAGFYSGATGVSGKAFGEPWALGTNVTPTGNLSGKLTLTPEQEKDLLAGNWYYSYGTTTNNNGEVRGQLSAKKP